MNLKEKSEQLNAIYHNSIDLGELMAAYKEAEGMLASNRLSPNNTLAVSGLRYRLLAKIAFLDYMSSYSSPDAHKRFLDNINAGESNLNKEVSPYPKTQKLYIDVKEAAESAERLAVGLRYARGLIFGDKNVAVATEVIDYAKAKTLINEVNDTYEAALKGISDLFGVAKMVDINAAIAASCSDLMADIDRQEQIVQDKLYGATFKVAVVQQQLDAYPYYRYHSLLLDDTKDTAPIKVICTPFDEELKFLTASYARRNSKLFCNVRAEKLSGLTSPALDYIFRKLEKGADCIVFYGLLLYPGADFENILIRIFQLSNKVPVVIHDSTGNRTLYKSMEQLVESNKTDTKPYSITYTYFSLPFFNDVLQESRELGLVTNTEDADFIKNEATFMGYIGLNEAVLIYSARGNWQKAVQAISQKNAKLAKKYLSELPSQELFLDSGWGAIADIVPVQHTGRERFSYDYDAARPYNQANLKKIIENPLFSLAEKSGLLVKYCLLHGEDETVWKSLDKQDKEERLGRATRMLAKLLNTEYEPTVEVHEQLSDKDAGGICCNGGKLIMYKLSCLSDLDWTLDTVCHETFHSLQHTADKNGWRHWYLTELGISSGRVEEWRQNFSQYIDLSKNKVGYQFQIVEADTRIFTKEAMQGAVARWAQTDLE